MLKSIIITLVCILWENPCEKSSLPIDDEIRSEFSLVGLAQCSVWTVPNHCFICEACTPNSQFSPNQSFPLSAPFGLFQGYQNKSFSKRSSPTPCSLNIIFELLLPVPFLQMLSLFRLSLS